MSDFTTAYDAINLDPYKRVHYAHGLVLGVEDFVQEELYLLTKDRLHNRALHGYGTICGLKVEPRLSDTGDPQLLVRAGVALDPQGREIRVPQDQCAGINSWLEAHGDDLPGSPLVSPVPLYLTLCYRECSTDDVPVPGGPCRSLEDSRVASRVADDFELLLTTVAPAQVEEDAVRAFGDLLRSIVISDAPGDFLSRDQLIGLVQGLGGGSPAFPSPGSPALHQLHPDDAADFLDAAFRVWVTEVRPGLLPEGKNCASGPPADACVLLAVLGLDVEELGGTLRLRDNDLDGLSIHEDDRPYLLHTRLLQEWLRNRSDSVLGAAGGDLDGSYPDPTVVGLQGNPVAPAPSPLVQDQVLAWSGVAWEAQTLVFMGGDLDGPYPDPTVISFRGDTYAAGPGTRPDIEGQVLTWDSTQWVAQGEALAEDDGPAVPSEDQVLTWIGGAWHARTLAFLGGDLSGTYPDPQIRSFRGQTYSAVPHTHGQILVWDSVQWVDQGFREELDDNDKPVPVPPTDGQVLTWVEGEEGRWEPRDPPGGGSTGLESLLVRIMSLSWEHGLEYDLSFGLADAIGGPPSQRWGFVLLFGRDTPGDAKVLWYPHGSKDIRALNDQALEVLVRAPYLYPPSRDEAVDFAYQWIGLFPREIIPVEPLGDPPQVGDLVKEVVRADPDQPASAIAFILDDSQRLFLAGLEDRLRKLERQPPLIARVLLRGDHVVDDQGHAIDAEHLRSNLPSGDRPAGADVGIQGGIFESWCRVSLPQG